MPLCRCPNPGPLSHDHTPQCHRWICRSRPGGGLLGWRDEHGGLTRPRPRGAEPAAGSSRAQPCPKRATNPWTGGRAPWPPKARPGRHRVGNASGSCSQHDRFSGCWSGCATTGSEWNGASQAHRLLGKTAGRRQECTGTQRTEVSDPCQTCMGIKISLILARQATVPRGIDEHALAPPTRSAITMTSGVPPAGRGNDRRLATNGQLWRRKPRRITITIPDITYTHLLECSNRQGRSISNLAAYLHEHAVQEALDERRGVLNHDLNHRHAA